MNAKRGVSGCGSGRIDGCRHDTGFAEEGMIFIISQKIELILNQQRWIMATLEDLNAKIAETKAILIVLGEKQTELATEMINAFNRLEAKLAAGLDTQSAINELVALSDLINTKSADLDSSIAQAKVTGI